MEPSDATAETLSIRPCVRCRNFRQHRGSRSRICLTCEEGGPRRPGARAVVRRDNLKRMYGITVERYEEMRTAQDHRCAICSRHEDDCPRPSAGRPRKDGTPNAPSAILVVDHDHRTGAVRGLLCRQCNHGIGMFRESPDALAKAIRYLSPDL